MRVICISETYCPYKSDTGYCGYTGCECIKEKPSKIYTVKVPDKPQYSITQLVGISDESIERIADAVIRKLHQVEYRE